MGEKIRVRVIPGARRSAIVAWVDGVLRVKVAAPPIDGRANAELTRFLAEQMGVPSRCVSVVVGQSGRNKLIEIEASPETVRRFLDRCGRLEE